MSYTYTSNFKFDVRIGRERYNKDIWRKGDKEYKHALWNMM